MHLGISDIVAASTILTYCQRLILNLIKKSKPIAIGDIQMERPYHQPYQISIVRVERMVPPKDRPA
jgi:hypothetical protein